MILKKKLKENKNFIYFYHKFLDNYYRYFFTDESFIKKKYKKKLGREVNLSNPKEFSEKLQWLKLNWFDSTAVKCVDKYEVRSFVKQTIGEEYLNQVYGVFESVDEIDLEKLPKSFVLKATHSSGYNFVCKDKNLVDWNKKFKEMKRWLEINYFWRTREWVYKDIKPRIICEKLLVESDKHETLTDYKIYCFNGTPKYCQVIKERESHGGTIDFFDTDWNNLRFTGLRKARNSDEKINRPEKFHEMLEISKILSQKFPFVRVDFYYVKNKIYFGELTFFPNSGFGEFSPHVWNEKLGDLLELPNNTI